MSQADSAYVGIFEFPNRDRALAEEWFPELIVAILKTLIGGKDVKIMTE